MGWAFYILLNIILSILIFYSALTLLYISLIFLIYIFLFIYFYTKKYSLYFIILYLISFIAGLFYIKWDNYNFNYKNKLFQQYNKAGATVLSKNKKNEKEFEYIILISKLYKQNQDKKEYLKILALSKLELPMASKVFINYLSFDYDKKFNEFLHQKNLDGFFKIYKFRKLYISDHFLHTFFEWIYNKKENLYNLIDEHSSKAPSFTILLKKMFFNKNLKETEEPDYKIQKSNFEKWGIVHYLARSGLHVSIIIFSIFFLLSFLISGYKKKILFNLFFILFFFIFSFSSISFNRAFTMIFLNLYAQLLEIKTDGLHIFSITTILFLIANPYVIFALDFQLSFAATFLLIVFFKKMNLQNN